MKFLRSSILVVVFSLGMAATVSANNVNADAVTTEQEPKQDQAKKELAMKDLPMSVQKDVKQKYPDAEFVSAWKMTDASGAIEYKILLNNEGQEIALVYDAEGQSMK